MRCSMRLRPIGLRSPCGPSSIRCGPIGLLLLRSSWKRVPRCSSRPHAGPVQSPRRLGLRADARPPRRVRPSSEGGGVVSPKAPGDRLPQLTPAPKAGANRSAGVQLPAVGWENGALGSTPSVAPLPQRSGRSARPWLLASSTLSSSLQEWPRPPRPPAACARPAFSGAVRLSASDALSHAGHAGVRELKLTPRPDEGRGGGLSTEMLLLTHSPKGRYQCHRSSGAPGRQPRSELWSFGGASPLSFLFLFYVGTPLTHRDQTHFIRQTHAIPTLNDSFPPTGRVGSFRDGAPEHPPPG